MLETVVSLQIKKGTINNVINNAYSLIKYSKIRKFKISLINSFGEWNNFQDDLLETASNFEGFDLQSAVNMFAELHKIWINIVKMGGQVPDDLPAIYDSLFLCYKSNT